MTNQINDGGPAFPMVYYSEPFGSMGPKMTVREGMSLHDYFAAAALQGLMASIQPDQVWSCDDVAVTCHRMADAMIKAKDSQ